MLKLKNEINFKELLKYGFVEDEVNCEHPEDHYYWLNNYYFQSGNDFRVTVNMDSRHLEILCLPKEEGLCNTKDIDVLFKMIIDGIIIQEETNAENNT